MGIPPTRPFFLEVKMAGIGIDISSTDREAIRLHRCAANKSRQVVADAVGRSPRWVARIERGGSATLTPADLMRLAAALGVNPDDLIGV